jgi:hypothetical protein
MNEIQIPLFDDFLAGIAEITSQSAITHLFEASGTAYISNLI